MDCNITDATELPNGSAAEGSQNCLYSKGTIATPYGFEKLGAVIDSGNPVLHIGSWSELDKTQHLMAVTKDKVYDRDFVTALWDEKTQDYDTTAVSLGGNINNPVSSATILHTDGILFNGTGTDYAYTHHILCMGYTMPTATADNSPIQRWAGKDETHYTDLLGANGYHDVASTKTKHFAYQVGAFYNRLLLINPLECDAASVLHENNQRVRWSMAGKLEVVPAWSGTGSGFYDLLDTGGYNVWGALLGMQWIQYQNNSIWSLTHVGGTTVFTPNIEMPDLGLLGAHCIYSKNNIHYFVGNDFNVYAYTGGSNLTRIGDKIQKYLQRDLDPTYKNQCYMVMGSNNSRLWLFIVPNNSLYITQAYGMDMRTGVWQKRDYMHKWPTGGISTVALVGAGGYHASETTALYQNYITGDNAAHPVVSGASWLAQTFTTGATNPNHNITSVRLKLYKTAGTSPGTVTVSIRATSSNVPTGADLCVGTINGDDLTESADGEWYRITFTSNPSLAGATKYAIIVRSVAASIGWRWDSSTPAYSTGNNCFSLDSGATFVGVKTGNITAKAVATKQITAFYNNFDGRTVAKSVNHGLKTGDTVVITGCADYNGTYVIEVNPGSPGYDYFIISHVYTQDLVGGEWTCSAYTAMTSAGQALLVGETINISGATQSTYNGIFIVSNTATNVFTIPVAFTASDSSGAFTTNADFMFEEWGSAPGSDVILLTNEKLTLGDSAGQVYQYNDSVATDDTVAIPARHITEVYDLELPSKNKIWPSITVTAKGTGLIVSYRTGNFETIGTGWVAFAEQTLTSEFADYNFTVFDTSRKIQFRFTNAGGDDFEISNYELEEPLVEGSV